MHAPALRSAAPGRRREEEEERLREPVSRRLRRPVPVWAAALLLGVTCFVVYNANLRTIGAGDTLASRYLPLIVWHHHTLGLDHDARLVAHGHPIADPGKQTSTAGQVSAFTPRAYWIVPT